jgi:hypothetical protein
LNRSVSAFNIPQVFQASFVYQLPFGRHQAYGSNLNPIVDAFLGGWQVNGIYRWDDGLPLGLGLNGGTSLPGIWSAGAESERSFDSLRYRQFESIFLRKQSFLQIHAERDRKLEQARKRREEIARLCSVGSVQEPAA